MRSEPRGCPFCLTRSVELIANFDRTLIAYRCPACQGVFYTITPQFDGERSGSQEREATSSP